MNKLPDIDWNRVDALIKMALDEDLGDRGDTTTNSVIDEALIVDAVFLAKEDCVCCGLNIAERLMKTVDPSIHWENLVREGDFCKKGTVPKRAQRQLGKFCQFSFFHCGSAWSKEKQQAHNSA